jgi:hypothetical protein
MADPAAATATQLRNIEARTGQSVDTLQRLIADSGLTKVGEQRKMLMERLGLGYGDANLLALLAKQAVTPAPAGADPLDALYTGAKAPLRQLHGRLIAAIETVGPHERAPKKGYVSLRRKKQFAMLGPATKDQLELGLNAKDLPAAARLKTLAPGGMCPYAVRLSHAGEIDAELMTWVRTAYEAAG